MKSKKQSIAIFVTFVSEFAEKGSLKRHDIHTANVHWAWWAAKYLKLILEEKTTTINCNFCAKKVTLNNDIEIPQEWKKLSFVAFLTVT